MDEQGEFIRISEDPNVQKSSDLNTSEPASDEFSGSGASLAEPGYPVPDTGPLGPTTIGWPHIVVFSLIGIIIFTAALLLALPVRDTDLWWQMGMGRYLLNEGTLVLDQTAFSWTPAHGAKTVATVYCAWIAEIFFYLTYLIGGLSALFAVRYICFLLFFVAIGLVAWRRNIFWNPLVWMAALLAFLMAYSSAAYIKPEILSFVFMTFAVSLWYGLKTASGEPWTLCYLYPVLAIIWANTHGGFIVGMGFLGAMGIGEMANSLYSPHLALPTRVRKHLLIALLMCAPLTIFTPYGWTYLKELVVGQLIGYEGDEKTIEAYLSIFTKVGRRMHLVEYLIFSGGLVLSLLVPEFLKKNFDWAIIFVYTCLTLLYSAYLRTCYFGGIVFVLTFLYLLTKRDSWAWARTQRGHAILASLVCAYCLFLSGRAIKDRVDNPGIASWIGFGTSYYSVVEETDYVEKYSASLFPEIRQDKPKSFGRIGNDYVSGGYLLWRLYPKVKVMIDPRHFPFHSWFKAYRAWELGFDVPGFLKRFPCDVWLINHRHRATINWYNKSPDYKLAFFGPSAVIYVKKHIVLPKDAPKYGEGLARIRSVHRGLEVLNFATNHQQWEGALKVLEGMKENFYSEKDLKFVRAAESFLEGIFAFFQRDYAKAVELLQAAKNSKIVWSDNLLAQSYIHLSRQQWAARQDAATLKSARSALALAPKDLICLFNVGVIEWYISTQGGATPASVNALWRKRLSMFVQRARAQKNLSPSLIQMVQKIYNGSYKQRPPLLHPKEPAPALKGKVEEIRKKVKALE